LLDIAEDCPGGRTAGERSFRRVYLLGGENWRGVLAYNPEIV